MLEYVALQYVFEYTKHDFNVNTRYNQCWLGTKSTRLHLIICFFYLLIYVSTYLFINYSEGYFLLIDSYNN